MGKKKKLPEIACPVCHRRFQPTRAWQRFCRPSCRIEAHRERHPDEFAEYRCFYCGFFADSIDHVPPRSVRPYLVEIGKADQFPEIEVRACRECNTALGRQALWTLAERRAYMRAWLRRRYKAELAMPDWRESELAELEPRLREHVEHGLALRDVLRLRLHWGGH